MLPANLASRSATIVVRMASLSTRAGMVVGYLSSSSGREGHGIWPTFVDRAPDVDALHNWRRIHFYHS